MSVKQVARDIVHCARAGLVSLAMFQLAVGQGWAMPQSSAAIGRNASRDGDTETPIKHVIVIIGENRSFDHVFATYVPKDGERVWNLLSEGIVTADGKPGRNFEKAAQKAAADETPDSFLLNPPKANFPNNVLPAPLVGGPKDSYVKDDSLTLAEESENGLPKDYYQYLVSGGTGQTSKTPDQRIADVNALPPGPFQLTNGSTFTYNSYAASPVHRFYQMWQQLDCSADRSSAENPSGCGAHLFPWVEVTVGAGTNGLPQPANFSTEYSPDANTTGEGSTAMGFYNVQKGDAPYFKHLADHYAMSDNFHQSVQGGTGANHIMLGHGDAIWFSDGKGNPQRPPEGVTVAAGTPNAGVVHQIENPNPRPGRTTGISRMVTAAVRRDRHLTVAVRTRLVPITRSREFSQFSVTWRPYRGRSTRGVNPDIIICSITTIRAISETAITRTQTKIRIIPCSRFHLHRYAALATPYLMRRSPGSTTAISGITTCRILIS